MAKRELLLPALASRFLVDSAKLLVELIVNSTTLALIGGHSTRIRGSLDIAQDGDLQELMRYGNWKSPAMR